MNAVDLAQTAYGSVRAPIRTPRSVEYEALARTTRALRKAALKGKQGYSALVPALHENRRLWILLGATVTDSGNELPLELRAKLGYLADFCTAHTSRVLRKAANPDILIEINLAVMEGLRTSGSDE